MESAKCEGKVLFNIKLYHKNYSRKMRDESLVDKCGIAFEPSSLSVITYHR